MEQRIIDVSSIIKNFSTTPLTGDELDEEKGFYVDTIEARTGNPFKSPIKISLEIVLRKMLILSIYCLGTEVVEKVPR